MWIHAPNGATECVLNLDSSKPKGNGTERTAKCWDYICEPGNCAKTRTTEEHNRELVVWQASGGGPFMPSGEGHIAIDSFEFTLKPCYANGTSGGAKVYNCYKNAVYSHNLLVQDPVLQVQDLVADAITVNCDEDSKLLPPNPANPGKQTNADCFWTQSPGLPGFKVTVTRPW
jgi:hypothetical protein